MPEKIAMKPKVWHLAVEFFFFSRITHFLFHSICFFLVAVVVVAFFIFISFVSFLRSVKFLLIAIYLFYFVNFRLTAPFLVFILFVGVYKFLLMLGVRLHGIYRFSLVATNKKKKCIYCVYIYIAIVIKTKIKIQNGILQNLLLLGMCEYAVCNSFGISLCVFCLFASAFILNSIQNIIHSYF